MPNAKIAALIARKLNSGIVHPGDPERGVKPRTLVLPFGMKAGQPQEMQDLMDATATALGEAIVHLIETEGGTSLVDNDDLDAMRVAGGEMPDKGSTVAVACRCKTPLLVFTMTHPQRAVVDGPALLRGLGKRTVHCPHEMG